jgi:hypothetical protein
MKNILFISAAIGYLGGLVCAYYVARKVLACLSAGVNPQLINRIGGTLGAFGVLPASILAAVIGGNFGGAVGAHGGDAGLILGVGLGIFLVMVLGIVIPASVTGYFVRAMLKKQDQNSKH